MGHLNESGNQAVENQADHTRRYGERDERTLGVCVLPETVIYHESDGRYAEQVEQMYGNRNAYHVGNQNQILVAVGLVGAIFPFENKPEHQRRAERRECVDFALHGREPEGVAPCIGEGAADARTENHEHLHR